MTVAAPFPAAAERSPGRKGLSDLLAARARQAPGSLLLADQPNRQAWSGRPPLAWTALALDTIASRLAGALGRLRLSPGSPVAICLPAGSEGGLAVVAADRAGLLPCLLPLDPDEAKLARAIEAAKARAVITQARVAALRPAEAMVGIAARYLGLRCVAGFGPGLPDGVMELDRAMLDDTAEDAGNDHRPAPMLLVFEERGSEFHPVRLPLADVVAASEALARLRPTRPGDRILALLPGRDLASLASGLVPALTAQCSLEAHGLFRSADFAPSFADSSRTHLVAPAWMEDTLAEGMLPSSVASVMLIHRPPARFRRTGRLRGTVVDAVAIGAAELLAAQRDRDGRSALVVPAGEQPGTAPMPFAARRDEAGRLLLPARGKDSENAAWRPSDYRVETVGDHLAAVLPD